MNDLGAAEMPKRVRLRGRHKDKGGWEREGWEKEEPQAGKGYKLFLDNGKLFRTTVVARVFADGFDTNNSEYRRELLETGKDNIIEELEETVDLTCEPRTATIHCMEGSMIQGHVNLKHEDRVSDLFTKGKDPFIVVFDAKVKGLEGKTIVLNKQAIAWVLLED